MENGEEKYVQTIAELVKVADANGTVPDDRAPDKAPEKRKSSRKVVATAIGSKNTSTASKPKVTIMIDSAKATVLELASGIPLKAKAALDKSYVVASEVRSLSQGNADACLQSGKILADGLKDFGSTYVAEGQAAIATLKSDIKDISAVKSPSDLFNLQRTIALRNIEAAFAFGQKSRETLVELARGSAAPITKQVGVVSESLRKVA